MQRSKNIPQGATHLGPDGYWYILPRTPAEEDGTFSVWECPVWVTTEGSARWAALCVAVGDL